MLHSRFFPMETIKFGRNLKKIGEESGRELGSELKGGSWKKDVPINLVKPERNFGGGEQRNLNILM